MSSNLGIPPSGSGYGTGLPRAVFDEVSRRLPKNIIPSMPDGLDQREMTPVDVAQGLKTAPRWITATPNAKKDYVLILETGRTHSPAAIADTLLEMTFSLAPSKNAHDADHMLAHIKECDVHAVTYYVIAMAFLCHIHDGRNFGELMERLKKSLLKAIATLRHIADSDFPQLTREAGELLASMFASMDEPERERFQEYCLRESGGEFPPVITADTVVRWIAGYTKKHPRSRSDFTVN